MWKLECDRWSYLQGRIRDVDIEDMRAQGEEMNWEIRTDVCAPPCVKQKLVRTYYCTLLSSLLLMTQRGRMAREVQEGGDRRIHMADSLHYTAETNTLESNYNPKKKKPLSLVKR